MDMYCHLNRLLKLVIVQKDGVILRRDLKPTITVRGSIYQGTANDATEKIYNQLADLQKDLPFGYSMNQMELCQIVKRLWNIC